MSSASRRQWPKGRIVISLLYNCLFWILKETNLVMHKIFITSLFFQVCPQSETHYPGRLSQLHGWDRRTVGGSTQHPQAAADWSQAGIEGAVRTRYSVPVLSQRAREMGWSPSGHLHSVGEGGSTHADQALWWSQNQEILHVASDSVCCCGGLGCLRQQEQPSNCSVGQDNSLPACTGLNIEWKLYTTFWFAGMVNISIENM